MFKKTAIAIVLVLVMHIYTADNRKSACEDAQEEYEVCVHNVGVKALCTWQYLQVLRTCKLSEVEKKEQPKQRTELVLEDEKRIVEIHAPKKKDN